MNSSDKPLAGEGQLRPEETHSNSSSTPWTMNANGPVDYDYLMNGSFDNAPFNANNSAISGTYMAFSPIARSDKPKVQTTNAASYPSQQLNSRNKVEPILDEEKCPTPPTSTTDDMKLPPPLPPVVSSDFHPCEAVSSNQPIAMKNPPVDDHKETGNDKFAAGLDGFVTGMSPTREAATALQSFKSGGDTAYEKASSTEVKSRSIRTSSTHPRAAAIATKPQTSSKKKKGNSSKKKVGAGIKNPGKNDILRGRGGYTNHHPGNIKFRNAARALRAEYRRAETGRHEKYLISVELVRNVKAYGGRFLEKGKDNLWYEMDENAARKKASQVLREEKWD